MTDQIAKAYERNTEFTRVWIMEQYTTWLYSFVCLGCRQRKMNEEKSVYGNVCNDCASLIGEQP